MRNRLHTLAERPESRCEEVSPAWRVSALHQRSHPEYDLSWELVIRKCWYFSGKLLCQKPLLASQYSQEDLQQELLTQSVQISHRSSYQELNWAQFSRLLTVALPNHAKNLIRSKIPEYYAQTLSSFTDEGGKVPEVLSGHSIQTIHLNQEQILSILHEFMRSLKRNLLTQLSGLPPIQSRFKSRAEEVLWVMEEAKENPANGVLSLLRTLGYSELPPRRSLLSSISQCVPGPVAGRVTALEILQLAWAS